MEITPEIVEQEITNAIKGSKRYEIMMEKLVNYIVMNYNPKKNRQPSHSVVIPKPTPMVMEVYDEENFEDDELVEDDIEYDGEEDDLTEEFVRKEIVEEKIKEMLSESDNYDLDDDFDDGFIAKNMGEYDGI